MMSCKKKNKGGGVGAGRRKNRSKEDKLTGVPEAGYFL